MWPCFSCGELVIKVHPLVSARTILGAANRSSGISVLNLRFYSGFCPLREGSNPLNSKRPTPSWIESTGRLPINQEASEIFTMRRPLTARFWALFNWPADPHYLRTIYD